MPASRDPDSNFTKIIDRLEQAVMTAINTIKTDIHELRKDMLPRSEYDIYHSTLTDRVSKIEQSPTSVRGWLNIVIGIVAALIALSGCFISVLIGAGTIIYYVVSLMHH